MQLSLSNMEHSISAALHSSPPVNIGQRLIPMREILAFSTRHGTDGSRNLRRADSCEPDNIKRPHTNRRASESENELEKT